MSLLSRASVALVLSSAFVLAIACSSSNKKQAPQYVTPPGDGGEGGAAQPSAGATGGGAAGMSEPGAAGEGGTPTASEAGAAGAGEAGATAEGGSAGAPELACLPSGSLVGMSVDSEPMHQFCRGGVAWVPLIPSAATPSGDFVFSCCAVSNAAYDFAMDGYYSGDSGGKLSFRVPAGAPKAQQSLTITCSGGELSDTATVELTDAAPPVVTTVTLDTTNIVALKLTGTNLAAVDQVWVTPLQATAGGVEATERNCSITVASHDATNIDCTTGYLTPGQYVVNAFSAECGSIDVPLTVTPPT